MADVKAKVIDIIKALPDDCTLEDIQYHLYVREKIEHGIQAINEGGTVSYEDAEKEVLEWLKSSGLNLKGPPQDIRIRSREFVNLRKKAGSASFLSS